MKPIVLKAMVFTWKHDETGLIGYHDLIERINKRSQGELIIQDVGGAESIMPAEQPEALRNGVFDFGVNIENFYGDIAAGVCYTHLSEFLPWEERERGYYDLRVKLLEKLNLRYLGRPWGYHLGYRITTVNKLIKNPREDFRGLKIRGESYSESLVKALGASPVSVLFQDLYDSAKRRDVDGAVISCALAVDLGFNEVFKYFSDPPVYTTNLEFMMNLDSWEGLPEHLKNLIEKCSTEHERWAFPLSAAHVKNSMQKMIDAGMKRLKWSQADTEWFRKIAVESAWVKVIRKINPPDLGQELVKVARKH